MKRTLYLLHRWLGVVLCLFMAMWFFSGVVMMYVGYPKLTQAERLAALPALDGGRCCASLQQWLRAAGHNGAPTALRLTSVAGRPLALLNYGKADVVALDGASGRRVDSVDAAAALAAARAFMPGVPAAYQDLVAEDAFSHSRNLDGQRPLHRVQMGDAESTRLYVSARTGEVVRDASVNERGWNWVGSWLHWLYPLRGGIVERFWNDIVVYTALTATALSLLGMLVGLWRWRFSGRFRSGSRSPYRAPWMRWHHLLGLVFGTLVVTFIFSGLMSMNPFKVLDSGAPKVAQRHDWDAAHFTLPAGQALQLLADSGFEVRELEWRVVDGAGYYLAADGQGRTRLLAAGAGPALPFKAFGIAAMRALGSAMLAPHQVTQASVLGEYDNYYYGRDAHTMTGGQKRLPVLRLKFDDPRATWLYIDPASGAVVKQVDTHQRVGRWLFSLLHSWDWTPLLASRPWWDVWMIAISVGGMLISVSGIVIGWRRLRMRMPR
ncbi:MULTISPECIES: PepSY domain-containing protein [unclassified Janthinobacterium]|uniref:PepSY domain-containing protein n=1 Tax=unclassified Janthinobacterium TaxID=2610881 RepID=UPI00034DB3AF|nr:MULTISPECIES: PepSY domain-containing protein [unclassified Janthinobacterium]MEC5162369.1 putative iron-regulated membrane protein [Janthinobacterium sp. CG_S6]